MNKLTPPLIALLEALGGMAYITLFVVVVKSASGPLEPLFNNNPFLGMGTFLLAFVTSALICAALVFGYPAHLVLNGEKEKALKTVAWSAAWLVVMLVAALAMGLYAA